MVCFVVHNHSLLYKWFFLEVKIAVFLFILSIIYLGCSEGILHLNYWSSSSGFFFIVSFFVRVDEHVI
jgi:hypothetical protein